VSAKGRNGTAELLRIHRGWRVSPAVCGILEVLARQYSAIGTEIASIDKNIMILHRACEASRRLAEIPRHRSDRATALSCRDRRLEGIRVGRQSCGLDRVVPKTIHHRRQG